MNQEKMEHLLALSEFVCPELKEKSKSLEVRPRIEIMVVRDLLMNYYYSNQVLLVLNGMEEVIKVQIKLLNWLMQSPDYEKDNKLYDDFIESLVDRQIEVTEQYIDQKSFKD